MSGAVELLAQVEVGQDSTELLGKTVIKNADSAELLGKLNVQQSGSVELLGKAVVKNIGSAELLGKAEVRGLSSAELFSKNIVQQSDSAELLGKGEIRQPGSAELLGEFEAQATAELLSNFRVSCPRRMGDNWQRKMWFDGTYYWRGRCDPAVQEIIFEYIAAAGLAGNVWTKNESASIDCSGFPDRIMADFTVRGGESGIPTTIHYSDGVDSHVAESNEASLTGWAWQNLTTVFTGGGGDTYRKVNLGANRTTPIPRLWVIAVFYDDPGGEQWVKARSQSTGGILGGWDAPVNISSPANTDTIYGCSVRSMGEAGLLRNDVMFVYKEGVELKSRYYDGDWDAPIEDIDTTTLPGYSNFDFEHGDIAGMNMGHIIYVDADSSIQWKERDSGSAEVWSAGSQLHAGHASHHAVGIVEHHSNWMWAIWGHLYAEVEYRVHSCDPEVWFPLLGNDSLTFDTSTEAVIDTSTVAQLQTPDSIPSGEAVPICWIGETAPTTPCAVGWGILVEYSIGSLKGILDIRHSTSVNLYAQFEVGQDSAELLGNAVVRQTGTPVELLGNAIIRQPGSVELGASCAIRHSSTENLDAKAIILHWEDLYGTTEIRQTVALNLPAIFWTRWPSRLWTSRRYINGVIALDEKLLGDASLEYVIEGVMEDTQGYLDNAGLPYSEWANLELVPVQILRAVTYGTVAALYARHTQTFQSRVIPSITPVTVTVIGDAEKAMNYWEDRTNQMLEFYVASQGGDVMLTSTDDEEPVFSMEDIPEEVTEFVSWRNWLQRRTN